MNKGTIVTRPEDVFNHLRVMSFYEEENFIGVYPDVKNRIIDTLNISKGSLSASIVHPREFFSPAVRLKAAGVIAVHNHPSSNPEPSTEDIETTKRLQHSGDILGIKFLDHIIIGGSSYCSLKEKEII